MATNTPTDRHGNPIDLPKVLEAHTLWRRTDGNDGSHANLARANLAGDEARAHWGAVDYHLPLSGRKVVACLDWLEREIANGLKLDGGAR